MADTLFPLSLNDRGERVVALQQHLSRLGYTIPQRELDEQVFGVGTQSALLEFQTKYRLRRTAIFDDRTQAALANALTVVETGRHCVEGRIYFEHGLPAAGITLRVYDLGFGGRAMPVGDDITTDDQGFYSLFYSPDAQITNLEVRAVAADKEISLSRTKFSADRHEVLNLVVPASLQPLAPEYKRLTDDINQYFDRVGTRVRLAEARESEERQDITLLHRATGWDARLIALAAIADKLSTETRIPSKFLYGLLRIGLPIDQQLLARVNIETVEAAIHKATAAGVISLGEEEMKAAKEAFERFARDTLRTAKVSGTAASFADLLAISGLEVSEQVNRQKIFEDFYFTYRGTTSELWTEAKKHGLTQPEIDNLRCQGKIAYLTLNNLPLSRKLQQDIGSPDNLAWLAANDFAHAKTWKVYITDCANSGQPLDTLIPPAYDQEKTDDRLSAYAEDLARKVRLSFPTQVIARMVATEEFPQIRADLRTSVSTFLNNAGALGFKLGQTPVDRFIQQHQATILKDIPDADVKPTIEQVKTLYRLYQITPSNEALQAVHNLGLTSASDVTAFPLEAFVNQLTKLNRPYQLTAQEAINHQFTPQEAKLIHAKAQQVEAVSLNIVTEIQRLFRNPGLYALSSVNFQDELDQVKNNLINQYPTLESLFGSLDFCECEHCQSVLSPAAYFVDLLQFLDTNPKVWQNTLQTWRERYHHPYPFKNQSELDKFLEDWKNSHPNQPVPNPNQPFITEKTPFEILFERRPDLPHLQLTCENTNTVLPYIDLVNEILEYYVVHGGLDESSMQDTGDTTTSDLLAEPQNIIPEAYSKLQEACYPLLLPYDLWIDTVRQFLGYFETPLEQILEVFRPTDELFPPALSSSEKPDRERYYRAAIFAESLNISPSEYGIFTNFKPLASSGASWFDKWFDLYGYPVEADAFAQLRSAKKLAERLSVSYKELVDIICTWFVNPQLEKIVPLQKVRVDAADLFRYQSSSNPQESQRKQYFLIQERDAFHNFLGKDGDLRKQWFDTAWQKGDFNEILVLAASSTSGNFDHTTLLRAGDMQAYSNGQDVYTQNREVYILIFLKINLFVRLWKKLGWTIEETDQALRTFLPMGLQPLTTETLGTALKTALVYLAHLNTLVEKLKPGKNGRIKLLTLWSNLPTTGKNSLYAQLFLTPNVLKNDPVFGDPLGDYLTPASIKRQAAVTEFKAIQENVWPANKLNQALIDSAQSPTITVTYDEVSQKQQLTCRGRLLSSKKDQLKASYPSSVLAALLDNIQQQNDDFDLIKVHLIALQGALNLTTEEIGLILDDAGQKPDTAKLSLENVSLLYRYGLLAKSLSLSIQDLIVLKGLAGIDPFKPLQSSPLGSLADDYLLTQTLQFIEIVQKVKDSGFQSEDLEYLLRHQFDPVGKYRSNPNTLLALVQSLASGIRRIQTENAALINPASLSDDLLRQKLGLVLSPDLVETLLSMVAGTTEYKATEDKVTLNDKLDPELFRDEAAIRITYNEVQRLQELTFQGVLLSVKKDELISRSNKPSLMAELVKKVQAAVKTSFNNLINTFLGMWESLEEYEAIEENVQLNDQLDPMRFAQEPAIRISYDQEKQVQRLAYRGVLLKAKKDELIATYNSKLLERLLDKVQQAARRSFEQFIGAFLGIWTNSLEYEAIVDNVSPEKQLDPEVFTGEPAIRLSYDEDSQTQRLIYRGALLDAKKAALLLTNSSSLLEQLLNQVQAEAQKFFDDQRQGFLDDKDLKIDSFVAASQEMGQTEMQKLMKAELVQLLLPFLQKKLIRQLIVQTLSTNLSTDPGFTETLLTNTSLLVDPKQKNEPLIAAFAGAGEQGITATFSNSAGSILPATTVPRIGTTIKLDGVKSNEIKSIHFEGYLEVPTSGAYRFFIKFSQESITEVKLWLADSIDPLLQCKANEGRDEISQFADLKAGVPHHIVLDIHDFDGCEVQLWVQGGNLSKGPIDRLTLYPQSMVDRVSDARVLLVKTLQLIQGLGLNERETRYLLTHKEDFNNLDLSVLPTCNATQLEHQIAVLFGQFLRLADYARLKRELGGGTDDFISVFENARRIYPVSNDPNQAQADLLKAQTDLLDDLYKRLADLTRRDIAVVRAAAQHLRFITSVPDDSQSQSQSRFKKVEALDFTQEKGIWRLWDTLQIVEKLGVSVEAMTRWATPAPDFTIAQDLRNTVKGCYEPENWQRIAQPIFDKLRQHQRDALVAYILHKEGFDRIEQLFEYFLIDPGMEPVVQTSRIRLAISSAQLFIQRCLLNLEPKVHPSAIDSKHWQWMKRYRVWEANLKIFLFPENWLEPEFRDDKTYQFQELESVLLQGDVSNDLAEGAFFKYMEKLRDIAQLEIVTMYCEEKPDPQSNILHVIGRTHNTSSQYFYRRYANHMWTPWEPVTADINGNHTVAVVWRERLYLFWLTFTEIPEQNFNGLQPTTDPAANLNFKDPVANLNISEMINTTSQATKKQWKIQLNWSEYFQGQWTNSKSSSYDKNSLQMSSLFNIDINKDVTDVFIHVSKESDLEDQEGALLINFGFVNLPAHDGSNLKVGVFRMTRSNFPPESYSVIYARFDPDLPSKWAKAGGIVRSSLIPRATGKGPLQVIVVEQSGGKNDLQPIYKNIPKDILAKDMGEAFTLLFSSNTSEILADETRSLKSQFFYQDEQNTFFVKPTLVETSVIEYEDYGISVHSSDSTKDDLEAIPVHTGVPRFKIPTPEPGDLGWVDPLARFNLQPQQDWITSSATLIQFDEQLVGRSGKFNAAVLETVIETPSSKLSASLQAAYEVNPNVIGGSGLNSAAFEALRALRNLKPR